MNVFHLGRCTSRLLAACASAGFLEKKHHAAFGDLRTYCLFLGYPQGSHRLIATLLNANSSTVIAPRFSSLSLLRAGYDPHRIYSLLLRDAEKPASRGRKSKHDYAIPGQWQGRFDRLLSIGERDAEQAVQQLSESEHLPETARDVFGIGLRAIHVVRNPFDQVAAMAMHDDRRRPNLPRAITHLEDLCERTDQIRIRLAPEEYAELRHEDFVANPGVCLREICEFTGVAAPVDYVHACSSTVFSSPRRRRHRVTWPKPLVDRLSQLIGRFDFLHGYAFGE